MQPYEELGVAPTATSEEIHAAYVALARRFHPDRGGDADPERMARINAAWAVLRDRDRRAALDATTGAAPTSRVRDPGDTWTPLVDDTTDDFDFDDTPTGARRLPRLVTLIPMSLFIIGVILVMFGMIVDVGPAAGLGGILIVAAAAAFVAVPVAAMMGAARAERDW